jgi:site-specific recombinase XerD
VFHLLLRAGYQHLEDIEPITVAAYIETLQRQAGPPTIKQHMAAIRMLFSWLTEKGVLATNPSKPQVADFVDKLLVGKVLYCYYCELQGRSSSGLGKSRISHS